MPVTPILDEGKILALLEGPVSSFVAAQLHAGSMMAVMAARDRKLPREVFQDMLEKAADLQRMVIRLQTLDVIAKIMQKETFAQEMAKNQEYCTKQGELCRKNLEYSMNLLAQSQWEVVTLN
jgi:hypothetical protein